MFRFFESISIVNGIAQNLFYHQARIDHTFKQFYPKLESPYLEYLLSKEIKPSINQVKCKFSYNENTFQFLFLQYIPKTFKKFHLVYNDQINYNYKFIDRKIFDSLNRTIPNDHQILIVKNKLLTDSSFSNLAFFDGYKWITPTLPLLKGTMRESLLAELKIHEEHIKPSHLELFSKFKLINALNSLELSPEYAIHLIQ